MKKNKCDKCFRRVSSVRSRVVGGKVVWLCDVCYKESENLGVDENENT